MHSGINLNRIFTRKMLRHFIDGKIDTAYQSAIMSCELQIQQKNNYQLIQEIYNELRNSYRNEYFYKNTLLNKLLLGVHSINTTTALTEVAISKSKADFILINGKATVYEIKTELDNLDKLNAQINDYYKAFDHVAVVTHENNMKYLEKLLEENNKPVGVYVLQKNERLSCKKKPQKYLKDLDKDVIFKLLRKSEYESILKLEYGYLPNTTPFRYYSECQAMFVEIPIETLYSNVLNVLKQRVQLEKDKFNTIPYELKFLAYFLNLTAEDYQQLELFLQHQYGGV